MTALRAPTGRWLFAMHAAALVAGLGAAANACALQTFEQVRTAWRSSDTVVLDRHGVPVQTVRSDTSVRRLDWVPLNQISPALRTALVLSEDKRFYEHAGVDWSAVGAAAWGNLWNTRTRGASTITMQLAGLLDDDLKRASGGRSVSQKIGQAATAVRLEQSWRKDQILEAYLNLVGYRGELVGVSALSATLFEKYPDGLDAREAAITAALVRAPSASARQVADRACGILNAQNLAGECAGLADYTAQVLTRKAATRLDRDAEIAPHLGRRLVALARQSGKPPARLQSTLDASLQRYARDTLRRHLAELAGRNVEDGAVIVIDNASGDVLAWVGSSGDLSDAAEVDGVLAQRQAGSTLKPFLYSYAIEKRWLTAASLLDDSPVDLHTAAGQYIPQNYDRDFKGLVSLRTALGSSLNVPAVRTLVMVTPERFHQRLTALGFRLRENGDYYGYSLALGSAEVTLASLSNAYRAFANGGRYGPLRYRTDDARVPGVAVMDPAASYVVADVLADRNARAVTFGLDNALNTRSWTAVKTGTSKDMRDNWCVGFSTRYTVGVWVGNASGQAMWDVSGVTGAAPVWRSLMDYLQRRDGNALGNVLGNVAKVASIPAGLVHQHVQFGGDIEAARDEWFLAGTEQSRVSLASRHGDIDAGITAPSDGTIVALDPDIPPGAQKLRFASSDKVPDDAQWRVDGRPAGRGRKVNWPLWPGAHKLELLDARGRVIDGIRFEVRGAELRQALKPPARAAQAVASAGK